MSANKFVITNVKDSIYDCTIKCKLTEDCKYYVFDTIEYVLKSKKNASWLCKISLYKNDKHIKIKEKYLTGLLSEAYHSMIEIISSQDGGKIRDTEPTIVKCGKNIGKLNETNVLTQAIKDCYSKYNKQLQKVHIKDDDSIKYMLPLMLVQKLNDTKSSTLSEKDYEYLTVQIKLNGVRVGSTLIDNKILLYSRGNKTYEMKSIEDELLLAFNKIMLEDDFKGKQLYLDGEVFIENKPLNYISGQTRGSVNNSELKYYIFDIFFGDDLSMIYSHRYKLRNKIFEIIKPLNLSRLVNIEDVKVSNMDEINLYYKKCLKDNAEGVIIRRNRPYELCYNAYHSANVLKLKPLFTDEYLVYDIIKSEKGAHSGAIVYICTNTSIEETKE